MNVRVVYHSLTGNTEKLACAIADTLDISAEPIGKEPFSFSEPIDLLFIGDGIYFGKANKRTISLINQLSTDIVKNAAIFATYGGQEKIGVDIKKLLQDKGIKVINEPFTCKGKAWGFINRKSPDENDLNMSREYAKDTAAKANQ